MAPEGSLRYKQQPHLLSIHFNTALPLTFNGLPRREKDDGQKINKKNFGTI
jgi:hypothetical protein